MSSLGVEDDKRTALASCSIDRVSHNVEVEFKEDALHWTQMSEAVLNIGISML